MLKPFPHHYKIELSRAGDGSGVVSADARPSIVGGPPPSFDGKAEWWSPEHLLLSAVGLCLMATFQAFATREGLAIQGYTSGVHGVLDRTPTGLGFTSITIDVELDVMAGDRERAERLLAVAKKHCIVANSLKPGVQVHSVVMSAA